MGYLFEYFPCHVTLLSSRKVFLMRVNEAEPYIYTATPVYTHATIAVHTCVCRVLPQNPMVLC